LSINKISTLQIQKNEEVLKIDSTKKSIEKIYILRSSQESRLNEILTNVLISRNPIQLQNIQNQINEQILDLNKQLEDENNKLKSYDDKRTRIDDDIFKLKVENSQKKDITTFKFVAEQFNTTIQNVVKWFIIVLITVFDPLAVILLIAYNISSNKQYFNEESENRSINTHEKIVTVEKPVEVEKTFKKIKGYKRYV